MENWKQERCNEIDRALERIQRRADRVVQVLNSLYDEDQQQEQQLSSQQQQQQDQQRQRQRQRRRQKQQQVSILTSELARLQDMNDRLFDFRDRLCFYSNLGYVESLNEWQYEIQKICVKAEGFAQCSHHNHHHHRNNHKHHRQDRQHSTGRVRNDSGQGCFRPLVPLMN